LLGVLVANLQALLADGLIRHDDSTGAQQRFDIPITEAEVGVPPDAVTDDLGREAVVFVGVE
jgi:hypothetical protein